VEAKVTVCAVLLPSCNALLVAGTVAVADGDTSLGESESATLAAQAILECGGFAAGCRRPASHGARACYRTAVIGQ
jgi:hypothetical protein